MDKRNEKWWTFPRWTEEFEHGIDKYIEHTFASKSLGDEICCPCEMCHYRYWHRSEVIKEHVICNGFAPRSDILSEVRMNNEQENVIVDSDVSFDMNDDTEGLLKDTFREGPNEDAKNFFKLVEEGQQELYAGCKKFSKLSFTIRLFISKCDYKLCNEAFGALLEIFKDALPKDAKLPCSFNEAKNSLKVLGLDYTKIDACPNDLIDYWSLPSIQEENKRNRAQLEEMHTMGPNSYAMLRHKLQQEDPNKHEPSQAKVYTESRSRNPNKTYKTSFGKTKDNIEQMEALASQEDEEGHNTTDPYYQVIKKVEHSGRLRLFGNGVTMTDLKKKRKQSDFTIPQHFLQSIQAELVQQLQEANPGINIKVPELPNASVQRDPAADRSQVNEPNGELSFAGTNLSNQHGEEDGDANHCDEDGAFLQ